MCEIRSVRVLILQNNAATGAPRDMEKILAAAGLASSVDCDSSDDGTRAMTLLITVS